MQPEDFLDPTTGTLIQTPQGPWAFVPAPPPASLTYDTALVLALSAADAALSELSGLGRFLPNPHLLISPYIHREAVLSSRIEGTRAGLADVWLDEMAPATPSPESADVQEVRNYVRALEYGIPRLSELPLSLRLVRELHAHLMDGVRGGQATPGEFRQSQNWIGRPGSILATATYVPPPPQHMQEALHTWERLLHDETSYPCLVQCALLHEHFEAIHPFLDGNGRVGRLLIPLFLMARGRLSHPLLYLSAYIEAHRDEYYSRLQRVRTCGAWTAWVQFFLTGITQTAQEAIQQAGQLVELREQFRRRIQEKAKAVALIDRLFENPYLTVARAAEILATSNPTARTAINALTAAGILRETTGRSWGRVYVAQAILDLVQHPFLGATDEGLP
jgi:Fic family protein